VVLNFVTVDETVGFDDSNESPLAVLCSGVVFYKTKCRGNSLPLSDDSRIKKNSLSYLQKVNRAFLV